MAAARDEPMNCSNLGMDVAGRRGRGGVDKVGMESTSNSRRDGVF